MSNLGIFIDESGDVGSNSEFYLITMVFHDQASSIEEQERRLRHELDLMGLHSGGAVHSGPIVRKEDEWKNVDLEKRRKVFFKMFSFVRLCPISYTTLSVRKKECRDRFALRGRLANELGAFLRDNLAFFQGFESVVVYYDNGQALVTDLINTVLCAYLTNVDVRKITPSEYRLSQAADMLCTLELMREKSENGIGMSKSELIFFESRRRLSKVFLKTLKKLEFPKS
ncbi:DUF3800 domain-containing protein [Adlercreutzia muris]|uniref:DUF3800 domain-containing protein n=1 Tax=Adlercreutzia muris TaxID=1796610 RepID=UPI001F5AF2EB|nr:DUF3800 domain-containing protein [Adlercreutzia muris]